MNPLLIVVVGGSKIADPPFLGPLPSPQHGLPTPPFLLFYIPFFCPNILIVNLLLPLSSQYFIIMVYLGLLSEALPYPCLLMWQKLFNK